MADKVVCVDLDGVIADGHDRPGRYHLAKLVPGALAALKRFRDEGWRVVIYTARREADRAVTERWLQVKVVPYDELVLGKPLASVYIDDRAVRFTGWRAAQEAVLGPSVTQGVML